uniref:Cytochrome P450 CYP712F1 n=1 Tax=Bupleurum chinense TaxID=52451 RepID=I3VI26_BUPCH|nr:cytochrome P450 CYP712F1 [Bupleurum chinense]
MAFTAMDQYFIYFLITYFVSALLFQLFTKNRRPKIQLRAPPTPPTIPIIGHIPLLTSPVDAFHKSLKTLAFRQGTPFMRISIGPFSKFMVVSKASIAKQILEIHDLNFTSTRFKTQEYGMSDGISNWDFLRHLLASAPQLHRFADVQKQEVSRLLEVLDHSSEQGEACDLGAELEKLVNNILFRMSIGVESGTYESMKIREFVKGLSDEIGAKSVVFSELLGQYGYGRKKVDALLSNFDEFLEEIVVRHEEKGGTVGEQDLVDSLMNNYEEQAAHVKPTKNNIKRFLVETLMAGSETLSVALKWTLAEIINHPSVLKKLREEIIGVTGLHKLLHDSDIPKLPYLQAVVKESLRLHPPSPLILRKCIRGCQISRYDVIPDSRIIINAYAIMQDPGTWKFPTEFIPQRFLESPTSNNELQENVKGENLRHLPFGSGSSACPGANLAINMMQMVVGKLVHCFDFEVKGGINMEEGSSGVCAGMTKPLICRPIVKQSEIALSNEFPF